MPEPTDPKSEVLRHWQNMFDDLKEWYKVADNRASGIISINSLLLGFVTISSFVGSGITTNEFAEYLLAGFLVTIMSSISLAIYTLWGRKRWLYPLFWSTNSNPQDRNVDDVLLYFGDIRQYYKANEENKREIGSLFFNNEFNKYTSKENVLKAIATQIVILSSNLYKRFWFLNISYALIGVSIIFMGIFTFVRFIVT
jgi:hypothetical protein